MTIDPTLYPVLFGGFLLLWAVLARRSTTDALVLALAGLLCAFLNVRHELGQGPNAGLGVWPELALAVVGFVMIARVFMTPLGFLHRIVLFLGGAVILLPFLFVAGLMLLFAGAATG